MEIRRYFLALAKKLELFYKKIRKLIAFCENLLSRDDIQRETLVRPSPKKGVSSLSSNYAVLFPGLETLRIEQKLLPLV